MSNQKEKLDQQLLVLTQNFLRESGSTRASRAVRLQADLERELGIGSLEKAELFHRLENEFKVKFPESFLVEAKTLDDVAKQLLMSPKKISISKPEGIGHEKLEINLSDKKTLNEIISIYAEKEHDRPYLYFQKDNTEEIVTYGDLYHKALQVAGGLQSLGVNEGDTISLMLPTGVEFFYAFYGILLAGAIPVPIYPPLRIDQIEEYINKEAKILFNAGIKVLISFKEARRLSQLLKPFIPSLAHITDVDSLLKYQALREGVPVEAEDIALLQYTSGSTGNPKGVVLTHENLLTNIRAYGKGISINPMDVVVSWLPLYHDMGLIGAVMGTLYHGIPLVLMSPLAFLMRPEKWLWAIHYRRATLSAAPNFAYELCTKKIKDEDIQGIDLSCWRLALNGAEAIYPETMKRFADRFAHYGFKKKAFFPAYGLAECAVALAFPPINREPVVDSIKRSAFETEKKAIPADVKDKNNYHFVSCGFPLEGHEIRIVDDHDQLLPERYIGNLQFRGPSAMQGYYRQTEITQAAYHDSWWSTGDMGYLANEELYITGRKKDLIIKAGRNYYPPEIEDVVSELEGVRNGCVAAFGTYDSEKGTEKLIVVVEKSPKNKVDKESLLSDITNKLITRIGIPPDEIILVPPRKIPKTSSGKLRRSDLKEFYEQGRLKKKGKSIGLQFSKIIFQAIRKKAKNLIINIGKLFYTLYVVLIVSLILMPIVPCFLLISRDKLAKLIKPAARLLFYLIFCPLKIKGKEYLNLDQAQIFVANHSSYADVVMLLTVLPYQTRFVAKKELLKIPVLSGFLKKLDAIFVDRMDISKNELDVEKIGRQISNGHSVLFFPEGTFTQVAGVRPFKSGPYKLSLSHGVPVCPVAIKNARRLLRGEQILLSPTTLEITIVPGKKPNGKEWEDMMSLRDWSRQEISRYCGEDPIDLIVAGPVKKT